MSPETASHTSLISRTGLVQFVKYSLIGASNTVITAAVIYLMQNILGYSMEWSNAVGYVAGLLNSFLWNTKWTFRSDFGWKTFGAFMLVFLLCYALQMGVLQLLRYSTSIDRYVIQLLAMGVFTVANFLMNKFVVYR